MTHDASVHVLVCSGIKEYLFTRSVLLGCMFHSDLRNGNSGPICSIILTWRAQEYNSSRYVVFNQRNLYGACNSNARDGDEVVPTSMADQRESIHLCQQQKHNELDGRSKMNAHKCKYQSLCLEFYHPCHA
jgi:hypothetical protein